MKRFVLRVITVAALLSSGQSLSAITADHSSVTKFAGVPASAILQARNQFNIFYGHTSHGSQIVTGMAMVRSLDTLYRYNEGSGTLDLEEYGDDLGLYGDTSWAPITRARLDQPGNDINLVMWSWCGGVSDISEDGINTYLSTMSQLEQAYPNVIFMYMTGHLDGSGPTGNLYMRNNQIRAYCQANNKVLFDFADIESYDPDGNWYRDAADDCAWCINWCGSHSCLDCDGCAHSHCLNCHLKGQAFWWLLARLAGWEEGPCCDGVRGNVNMTGIVDLSDLTALVSYLTGGGYHLPCADEANVNSTGIVDLSDLSALVSFLTGGGYVPPMCP